MQIFGRALLHKPCRGGWKHIFRGGCDTRPCFSQLKMRFAGAGNTPVPKNLFLGAGYALTRQIFDAGGCVLIVPDYWHFLSFVKTYHTLGRPLWNLSAVSFFFQIDKALQLLVIRFHIMNSLACPVLFLWCWSNHEGEKKERTCAKQPLFSSSTLACWHNSRYLGT